MKKSLALIFGLLLLLNSSHSQNKNKLVKKIASPDGKIGVAFNLKDGSPVYSVEKKGIPVIKESKLGFTLVDQASLNKDFKVVQTKVSSFNESWTQPWGEVKNVVNNYNSLEVALEENTALKRKMNIVFRVYNDGIGFQYEIPKQEKIKEFQIKDEVTEFNLANDPDAWWIPAYGDQQDYEYLYKRNKVSELKEAVHTPLTMEVGDSLFISIHEACLVDYAGMALLPQADLSLKADLVPWSDGVKVKTAAPMKTPWRTIQIGEKAGDLITSNLILNLNEPNKIGDVSWVKPGKYNGMWWSMHMKKHTWQAGPDHGATTQNVKELIDFASQNNIQGVLVEGWNEGWEDDWALKGNFSFTKSYPDYNISELVAYAKDKEVSLIGHHETGANIKNYEDQVEGAFAFLEKNGIHAVKTGYVGKKLDGKEYHQSQYMVRHQQKILELAAKHKVMLDIHEPIKDTGLRRTYPNLMTREGARGMEYEAWSEGNPPNHTTILPFTRCLSGPLDYTPGIFDLMIGGNSQFRVHTTLAKQLALYVVIYSPLQMVADLPENYKGQPSFKFIKDVPADWEETKIINGKIGQYITVVRRDRGKGDWYLGSITNEEGRTIELDLSFLTPGKKYKAEIYQDGEDANFESNPLPVEIRTLAVESTSNLSLKLASGGGSAIRFQEVQ